MPGAVWLKPNIIRSNHERANGRVQVAPITRMSSPRDAGVPSGMRAVGGLHYDRVFRDHAPYVWRVLRRLGVREADMEGASQAVFLAVHRRQAAFDGRCGVKTWLSSF